MKQLVIGILIAAVLSLGYRLVGTITADASDAPAPPPPKQEAPRQYEVKNPIQPAAGRMEPSQRSHAVLQSVAKPILGDKPADLGTTRMPPPAAPPEPPMVGPDGIAYHRVGAAPSLVSGLRKMPPPAEEPLAQVTPLPSTPKPQPAPLVREDKPLSPEPPLPPQVLNAQSRGKMVGPDGIEFHPAKRDR